MLVALLSLLIAPVMRRSAPELAFERLAAMGAEDNSVPWRPVVVIGHLLVRRLGEVLGVGLARCVSGA